MGRTYPGAEPGLSLLSNKEEYSRSGTSEHPCTLLWSRRGGAGQVASGPSLIVSLRAAKPLHDGFHDGHAARHVFKSDAQGCDNVT